ncbi:MAG: FeS-binding protein [Desulfovibrionales bacterium]
MHSAHPTLTTTAQNILRLSVLVLAVSGIGQMPIFKRYYLADIPGFSWLADFMFLHILHYTGAIVFALIVGAWLGRILAAKSWARLSAWSWVQAAAVLLLVGTGIVRVLKNMSWFTLTPMESLITVQLHLGAAVFLGLFALVKIIAHAKTPKQTSTPHGSPGIVQP